MIVASFPNLIFPHKILTLHFVVWLITGIFKNVNPAYSEGLLCCVFFQNKEHKTAANQLFTYRKVNHFNY